MNSKARGFRPSGAMVVAFVALFVALAGTAFSGGSKVPGKNGVKSSDIAPMNVKTSDLKDAAVTSQKLAADSVTDAKLAANAVTSGKVANNALTGADIDYGSHVVAVNNGEGASGAQATCPEGEIATGGGADSSDNADTGALESSFPEPNTGQATQWQVFYASGANAGDFTAYVICMPG